MSLVGQNFRHQGFTLVELVSAMVIGGLLAAVAIPRLVSLTEEVRLAQVAGVLGALRLGRVPVMAQY